MSTEQDQFLRGAYDNRGILQINQEGNVLITVKFSRNQGHRVATVMFNGVSQAFVTFGMKGERMINTYVNGFTDETRLHASVQNVMAHVV